LTTFRPHRRESADICAGTPAVNGHPRQFNGQHPDPTSPTARAILGSANTITAALCSATGGNPSEVCDQPSIKALQALLASAPVPSSR
jgi:hypothetical protein